jgi:ferric-dicitrate binding protein FerR (iron transport regulator)
MSEPLVPGPDEGPIRNLLVLAGRRPEPPAFRTARVRATVEAEWRRATRRRPRWPLWSLAAACGLALVLLWPRSPVPAPAAPPAAPAYATLIRVTGAVQVGVAGSPAAAAATGLRMRSDTTIETGAGRALLSFASGHSVRLDHNSRIVLQATKRVALERGRIYVDSGDGVHDGEGLQIATPSGVVREIGTRFEVAAGGGIVQVRVRDGAVRIDGARASVNVTAAEAVRIDDAGLSERRSILPSGPEWSWLETIAPPFAIEGATLESFLHWVSREQGWEWRYRDDAAARHAARVVLHGTIEGLTPAEALDAVLPTCGMEARRRGARLVVGIASPRVSK